MYATVHLASLLAILGCRIVTAGTIVLGERPFERPFKRPTEDVSELENISKLHRRQDCQKSFTTDVTELDFQCYCGLDFDGLNIAGGQVTADDDESCMNQCAYHTGDSTCWGITYSQDTQTCTFKGKGVSPRQTNGAQPADNNSTLCIASTSQLSEKLDRGCPHQNGSTYVESDHGMPFEILCDSNIAGPAIDWPQWYNDLAHTESLDDCISWCASHDEPQCFSVVYDPTMSRGWPNCYPKWAGHDNVTSVVAPQNSPPFHAAVAKTPTLDNSCTDGQVTGSSGGQHFKIACNKTFDDDFLGDPFHTNTLEECLSRCDEAIADNTSKNCVAVAWDPLMYFGFANCHLKVSNLVPKSIGHDIISAFRTSEPITKEAAGNTGNSTTANDTNSSDDGNDSNRTAVIAGATAGSVAFVLIVINLIWLYRHRHNLPWRKRSTYDSQSPSEWNYARPARGADLFEADSRYAGHYGAGIKGPVEADSTTSSFPKAYMMPNSSKELAIHIGDHPPLSPVELDAAPRKPGYSR